MNWGKGLALTLIGFAALMAWFVVKAAQNPEPLVTERYYEQELTYQRRIDDAQRANGLSGTVGISVTGEGIRLVFPREVRDLPITGTLTLMRPNDPAGDLTLPVSTDTTGTFTSGSLHLQSGRYNAQLEWKAGTATYYTEEKLIAP